MTKNDRVEEAARFIKHRRDLLRTRQTMKKHKDMVGIIRIDATSRRRDTYEFSSSTFNTLDREVSLKIVDILIKHFDEQIEQLLED
jgi:hypothetical protein